MLPNYFGGLIIACVLALGLGLSGCERAAEFIGLKETAQEKEERLQKMLDADKQVNDLAAQLTEMTSPSGGFVHHQGLAPVDPWGNWLKITYAQVWSKELLTVRSAGPDQRMDSDDDLVRVMETSNLAGIVSGIPTGCIVLAGWLWFGLLACACSSLLCRGRRGNFTVRGGTVSMNNNPYNRRSPAARYFIALLAGPLAFAFWGLMLARAAWTGRSGLDFPDDFESTGTAIVSTDETRYGEIENPKWTRED